MLRRIVAALAASSLAFLAFTPARAEEYRITGPVTHENLSIYLVHGKSATGPVPLTLDEALARRSVKVHETGNVNELQIENLGGEEVFVQSGDIVKGGQQDRVLTVSLILPPNSGRIPIASFCVEQGRWTARGKEDVKTFATASAVVPSREAKIAMKAPVAAFGEVPMIGTTARTASAVASETSTRQQEVWQKVRKVQDGLSQSLGTPVNAPASQSSLQLALENQKLKDAQAAFINALQRASTLIVQKSLKEGFGLTVTEALWKSKPTIAGAVGGIPTQVIHKLTGVLVHSVEGCAYQIRYLLTHPEFAKQLGKNGHEHVKENLLMTTNVRRWVLLFRILLGLA